MMALFSSILAAASPVVGDVAPDFESQDIDGNKVVLTRMLEHGPLVLAFFPKAFTPG